MRASLSPSRLAAAIATRLDRVVPDGLSVQAEGPVVGVADPDWWGGSAAAEIITDNDDRSDAERVECAARAILGCIQDQVMESTKEQWPLGPGGVGEPEARVIEGQLHLWFGSELAPALRLDPIAVHDIQNGAA